MAQRNMTTALRIAFLVLPLAALPSWAVEHPGVVPQNADCSSCHARQITGRSVHSAMAASCTVCHVAQTQGDMTTLSLAMPKEQICFACHEKSAALQQHVPVVKGSCVDCHDSHSSGQRMLLLKAPSTSARNQKRN
ncbi:MAG TPA: cytochrome c3 family protein [Candidatus Sulfotelmatobacter sp.]|nr:cytochrome c3 family protein [Candidatus Sulfotelmatobacter sp.]